MLRLQQLLDLRFPLGPIHTNQTMFPRPHEERGAAEAFSLLVQRDRTFALV